MLCPHCKKELVLSYAALQTHLCAGCDGVFIPKQGIATLLEKLKAKTDGYKQPKTLFNSWLSSPEFVDAHSTLVCPYCRYNMYAVMAAGIELDFCTNCQGMWFDRGELNGIKGKIQDGSLESLEPGAVVDDDHDASLIFHMLKSLEG